MAPEIRTVDPEFKPARYWMVHCATQGPTSKIHKYGTEAHDEAHRLAAKHPGQVFAVLCVECAYWQPPNIQMVSWENVHRRVE